ncbi:MAG TPA: heavy metal-binding domain-containing protein [Acidimicrobiales bacterium]|nr:heavy metal-binding domain-containing protein [Acidimicrobiales bacterium]
MSDQQLDPVAAQRLGEASRLFTSELTVAEFALLEQLGCQPLGFVMGTSIYHVGWAQQFRQNCEVQVLSQAMYASRELAMSRMQAEADALGADGVVGVQLEWKGVPWSAEAVEFMAFGTAIRGPQGSAWKMPGTGRAFTSDLSVDDFYRLVNTGYIPVAFVLGTCVYHLAIQSLRQMWSQMARNTEMGVQTQGLYEARELAMSRMQAEAERDGATGIVGVRVTEHRFGWESHVTEFLALGTSIRPGGDRSLARPTPVITL